MVFLMSKCNLCICRGRYYSGAQFQLGVEVEKKRSLDLRLQPYSSADVCCAHLLGCRFDLHAKQTSLLQLF